MAGGTFDKSVGKVRPGTYINFEASNQSTLGSSDRGMVLIPLINHSYGPEKEFITISNESVDSAIDKLGYSVYDDDPSMLLIREAFKNASTVIVYIAKAGTKGNNYRQEACQQLQNTVAQEVMLSVIRCSESCSRL